MAINKSIHTIDLMLGIPEQEDRSDWYTFMEPLLRDEESKSMFKMPAQYMFKDIPETGSHDDFIKYTIDQMDKHFINQAMVGFHEKSEVKIEAATLNRLIQHLRDNKELQNIDLMNLAGFCRNCISKWMVEEAEKINIKLDYNEVRKDVY